MKQLLLLSMLIIGLLAACGPADVKLEPTEEPVSEPILENAPQTDTEATSVPEASEPETPPTAAPVEESAPDAYPAVKRPSPTPFPQDYPQPEIVPTLDPYPGASADAAAGNVFVIIPAGEQCADGLTYDTEKDAVTALEADGVPVINSQTVELPVLAVCGGPTSTQYVAEINVDDLATAESDGWTLVDANDLPDR
ncbi:MAG: hypothetical protein GY796_34015 [Chloroflexi bacterium]|nr:hypothetical protein [Chloroflexota bacterium]